jgi:Dyp-type peroxidase family
MVGDDQPHQGVPGQDLLWLGEFVLGYPTQIPDPKPGFDGPNPDKGEPSNNGPAWTRNGSYMVFRRIRQDVEGFHGFLYKNAPSGMSPELFGAKLVGRYASGCPLERTQDQSHDFDPSIEDPSINDERLLTSEFENNFEYGDDPKGEFVPRAAHIRKAYPRDQVFLTADGAPDPNSRLQESFTQTRRLLRRGIPFGTSFRPSLGAQRHGPHDSADRGLLFLCYQRSIRDQFEFVQSKWANNVDFPQAADGSDPIIAQSPHGPFQHSFKGALSNLDVSHFVTTTGGEYFFQPSINALKMLAGLE